MSEINKVKGHGLKMNTMVQCSDKKYKQMLQSVS